MNLKQLSRLILFSGIVLLLVCMFIIPAGGCSESNPQHESNTFFFLTAEIMFLVGLIFCFYTHRTAFKEYEEEELSLEDLKNECDLNGYETTLGEEQS